MLPRKPATPLAKKITLTTAPEMPEMFAHARRDLSVVVSFGHGLARRMTIKPYLDVLDAQ